MESNKDEAMRCLQLTRRAIEAQDFPKVKTWTDSETPSLSFVAFGCPFFLPSIVPRDPKERGKEVTCVLFEETSHNQSDYGNVSISIHLPT